MASPADPTSDKPYIHRMDVSISEVTVSTPACLERLQQGVNAMHSAWVVNPHAIVPVRRHMVMSEILSHPV